MAALMTIVNSPSVRIVIGRDSKLTIGRTNALTRPKISPMNR